MTRTTITALVAITTAAAQPSHADVYTTCPTKPGEKPPACMLVIERTLPTVCPQVCSCPSQQARQKRRPAPRTQATPQAAPAGSCIAGGPR